MRLSCVKHPINNIFGNVYAAVPFDGPPTILRDGLDTNNFIRILDYSRLTGRAPRNDFRQEDLLSMPACPTEQHTDVK
ncbi:hypothetical protein SAMN06269250_1868 [Spirosoma fluviale]|uniref:Uncharacterized protein n=1 Tax=Spirosoma fluviale TaxID=1597977 RepID=A0A286FFT6_9BACT|nr:hypothetical protein SAMN06269250_1868 [Spirosoma fluviale]